MATPTIFDSTLTNPGGTGSTLTVTLPTHAVGDIIYISIGNTGNTLWTGNPTGWTRINQSQVGTSANGLLGTWFWRKVVSGDSLPLTNPTFTLGATVTRMAIARSIRGADLESPFALSEWNARAYNTGTANPVRPATITTFPPETLILHDYFQRAATNAPDPSGYTQDEEIIISGTLVGNGSEKNVADQQTPIANQDASPTSGVRWVAGILAVPSPDYSYYRAGSQALTASGTSATPALPTGTSSSDNRSNKDLVIATIEVAGTPTISPQVGADWTEITGWANTTSGNGSTVKKYWSLYDGSLNTQFNRSTTGEIFVYLSTYRNTKQSSPIGASAVQQNATSTTSTFPSLARTASKVTVQATCVADATPTYTSPTGWTERNDSNGVTCSDQPFNPTATVSSASFTLSAGSPTLAGLMEIKSVSSVGEFARSALIDAVGTVLTSAIFFSVFTRQSTVDAVGAVITSGVRIVSRSVALDCSVGIASSGTASSPASTLERSASLSTTGAIDSAATFFSVFERTITVQATGNIASTATFFSTFERSVLVDTTASISSTALFFSTFTRSVSIDSSASIESVGQFFTTFQAASAINGAGAITSGAEFFSTFSSASAFDVTAGIDASAQFFTTHISTATLNTSAGIEAASQFYSTLTSSAQVSVSAGIESTAQSFTTFESASLFDCVGDITTAGETQSGVVTFERSASLASVGELSSSAVFWSVFERLATHEGIGVITTAGQRELIRTSAINALAGISVLGSASTVHFHPHGRGKVSRENRILSIGEENRRA